MNMIIGKDSLNESHFLSIFLSTIPRFQDTYYFTFKLQTVTQMMNKFFPSSVFYLPNRILLDL